MLVVLWLAELPGFELITFQLRRRLDTAQVEHWECGELYTCGCHHAYFIGLSRYIGYSQT